MTYALTEPATVRFTGRLNGKKLKLGRYQLVATPTTNGHTGRSNSAPFRIIK